MKAKYVYEFVQRKDIKTEIGSDVLQRRSIDEWFSKFSPDTDYYINDDFSVVVKEDIVIHDATYELDELIVNDGNQFWFLNGKRHREDGPAIEYKEGDKYWFLNGIEYTEEKYNEKIKNL